MATPRTPAQTGFNADGNVTAASDQNSRMPKTSASGSAPMPSKKSTGLGPDNLPLRTVQAEG